MKLTRSRFLTELRRVTASRRMSMLLRAMALAAALAMVTGALAEDPTPKPKEEEKPAAAADESDKKPVTEEKEEQEKEEEKKDRYFAVTGGVVHTVTNGDLSGVTILVKNGKILDIGRSIHLPDDTEVLDASGFHIYPGFIAVKSSGLLGSGSPEETTNVYGFLPTMARAGGITTAVAGNTAAKLTYGTVEEMIVKRDLFKTLKYSTRQPNDRRKLRAEFDKVRQYMRDLEAYEEAKKTDPDAKEPDKKGIKGKAATYLKLMRHEAVAVSDANDASDILALCDLAIRYNIQIVVRGAVEGWTVASHMARAGMSAFITPRADVGRDERLIRPNGSSIENAAILYEHGVPIAVVPRAATILTWGVAGRDLLHLNLEAAFAVRGGLPQDAALRAITIDAARILGIDHRVGSIEIGKDADFVITDGDPLHYMTLARWTIVNGRIAYDKQKETLYSHIRPGGEVDPQPPDDYWPRRLGADQ